MFNDNNYLRLIKDRVATRVNDKDSGINFFLNPYTYLLLRNRPDLLIAADRIYIDGKWLCNFLRWFRIVTTPRVSFDNSSLAPSVFENANSKRLKIGLVGSSDEVADKFRSYIQNKYPNIIISMSRSGYFSGVDEIEQCCNSIIDEGVDIVIAGMGAIKQEEFLVKLSGMGWDGTGYTCGGFMHQTASKGHLYYPDWINKLNLRFAYRIWDEPKLVKRYSLDYLRFVLRFFKDYLAYK